MAVPLIVAALMVSVSIAVSNLVLTRLAETQAAYFRELTGAFLDGLSTALKPYVMRRDAWEAFDAIDRARTKYAGTESRLVLVVLNDDTILAASDPLTYPINQVAPEASRPGPQEPHLDVPDGRVWVHRLLREGNIEIGRIAAQIDVRKLQQERRETLWTLVLFNTALTLMFVVLGWLLVRRVMKPLMQLSDYLARSNDGRLEPIAERDLPPFDTDVGRAYRRYNTAAAAIAEREALLQRLAEQERRALIGRYASAMAHEVNNPLGGLFNAVRMIERHGDNPELRLNAARLLQRGLTGIHNIVRASLMTWRGEMDDSVLTGADIEDIRSLIQSEANRRELSLDWRVVATGPYAVSAQAVRQVALNLLLNACAVSPPGGVVRFEVTREKSGVVLSISDQGPGMPEEARRTLLHDESQLSTPVTGLGLWAVSRLARTLNGTISLTGPPGTCVTVKLPDAIHRTKIQAVA